jgi:hypothetical protein
MSTVVRTGRVKSSYTHGQSTPMLESLDGSASWSLLNLVEGLANKVIKVEVTETEAGLEQIIITPISVPL